MGSQKIAQQTTDTNIRKKIFREFREKHFPPVASHKDADYMGPKNIGRRTFLKNELKAALNTCKGFTTPVYDQIATRASAASVTPIRDFF